MRIVAASAILATTIISGSSHPALVPTPSEGHSGDTVYLSGTGYPSSSRLAATITCLNARGTVSRPLGRHEPRTNRRGRFLAYGFRLPKPPGGASSCSVYVGVPGRHKPPIAAFANVTVLPHGRRPGQCARLICSTLRTALSRTPRGYLGIITVSGWPGAGVDVTVTHPIARTQRTHASLRWPGRAVVHIVVAPTLKKALRARVTVRVRLGHYTGSASARFFGPGAGERAQIVPGVAGHG